MKRIIKPLAILAALAVMGYLFYQSVQSTRSAPYTMPQSFLRGWTVAIEAASAPSAPALSLRPPTEIGSGLFRQLFERAAESMSGPRPPIVPLLLGEEFERSFAGASTLDALSDVAREAGLDGTGFAPRCMALKRESAPGVTRQLYFLVFDAPAFTQFRQRIASMANANATYDPAALSPVLFIAASDANFNSWLPLRANVDSDCIAPIAVE
jgi:hypothetical protein